MPSSTREDEGEVARMDAEGSHGFPRVPYRSHSVAKRGDEEDEDVDEKKKVLPGALVVFICVNSPFS